MVGGSIMGCVRTSFFCRLDRGLDPGKPEEWLGGGERTKVTVRAGTNESSKRAGSRVKGQRPSLLSLLRGGLFLARASITSWILHSSFWMWMCRWLGGSVCGGAGTTPVGTGALWE